MRALILCFLLLPSITSACLRGSNSLPKNHDSSSPINKFLEKHFPSRSKFTADEAPTDNHYSKESTAGYWTIYFGNPVLSSEKDIAPSDQEEYDLSPSIKNISVPPTETTTEPDYKYQSSVESVYAQYGIASSYDTYDYQSYYSNDDVEKGLFYSPDGNYIKANNELPLNVANEDERAKFEIGNLFAIIASMQFPMIFSISTTDREAIYIDGGIGDTPQLPGGHLAKSTKCT